MAIVRSEHKYRCKYIYEVKHGWVYHTWAVVGARGAVHLHITDTSDDKRDPRYSGGIEFHYRVPPDYMSNEPPSHDECWLLHQPCWHDGSSLAANEYWIPMWEGYKDGPSDEMHKAIFDRLCGEASARFHGEKGEK